MIRKTNTISKPAINKLQWKIRKEYDQFHNFISLKADRYAILLNIISSLRLKASVITIANNRHIFIFPPGNKLPRKAGESFPFSGKSPYILTAHYDRVAGSPGANDNSIAVFHLLCAAKNLLEQGAGNWIIIFTDKEELKPGESLKDQGSFTLGEKLRVWGLEKAKVYNFDVCGNGNAFIFSTTADVLLQNQHSQNTINVKENIAALRNKALVTADYLRLEKVLLAPVPFSDDAGFLRAGIASQTVTILPAEEADLYEALLRSKPEIADLVASGGIKESQDRRRLPQTWQRLNSASDTHLHLTPQYFEQVVNFMTSVCINLT